MELATRKIILTDPGVLPATARIHSNVSEPGVENIRCSLFQTTGSAGQPLSPMAATIHECDRNDPTHHSLDTISCVGFICIGCYGLTWCQHNSPHQVSRRRRRSLLSVLAAVRRCSKQHPNEEKAANKDRVQLRL